MVCLLMALFIYIRRHLTPLAKTHLAVIAGFDTHIYFELVDGSELIDRSFSYIRTSKPGKLIRVSIESGISYRRFGAFMLTGLIEMEKEIVIVPGLRSDPVLHPDDRNDGKILADRPAYAWSRVDEAGIVHYDVTSEPWKYRPNRTQGATFYAESVTEEEIELTRPEVLMHELSHLEFHYRFKSVLDSDNEWTTEEIKEQSNDFAIRRTNRYRAWKHKSMDEKFMRKDHEGYQRVHTWDPATGKITIEEGSVIDFSMIDWSTVGGPIELDVMEDE